MAWVLIGLSGLVIWLAILLAPWRPWSTREHLESTGPTPEADLSDITALIPARNEAAVIRQSLEALCSQGGGLSILVIDDESEDDTAEVAGSTRDGRVRVLRGRTLRPGWAGKLWALEHGAAQVKTPLILLLDADIRLEPGILSTMRQHLRAENLSLLSLMATLPMQRFWEKLLIPPFVLFFKLLYPFHLANARGGPVAAAAGGCILLEAHALHTVGGFRSIRNALIDDCALAKAVKRSGFRTYIGLSRSVRSLRGYPDLASIWNMVARSAFTQLRYSTVVLLAMTVLLVAAFWSPIAVLLSGSVAAQAIGALTFAAMVLTFLPTLIYYDRSPLWSLALPVVGALYLAMTWSSAFRYWRGIRSVWKNRVYAVHEGGEADVK